jgi:hypothetical protein
MELNGHFHASPVLESAPQLSALTVAETTRTDAKTAKKLIFDRLEGLQTIKPTRNDRKKMSADVLLETTPAAQRDLTGVCQMICKFTQNLNRMQNLLKTKSETAQKFSYLVLFVILLMRLAKN